MRHRAYSVAIAAIAVTAVLSACSSSGSSTSTPASTARAAGESTAYAAVQKALAAYTTLPASLPPAPALRAAPPRGKTFVFLSGGTPYEQLQIAGDKVAAAKLGWNFKVISTNLADPTSALSGLTSAIDSGANAVEINTTPMAEWKSAIPIAQRKNVLIIDLTATENPATTPAPKNVVYLYDGVTIGKVEGTLLMEAAIVNAGGKTAELKNVAAGDIPALGTAQQEIINSEQSALKAYCASCSLNTMNLSVGDLFSGKGPSDIVSYLESHPNSTYLLPGYGSNLDGLTQAVQAAGLPALKSVVLLPTQGELNQIKAGTIAAGLVLPYQELGFEGMDLAARFFTGAPTYLWPAEFMVVTKANISQLSSLSDPEYPTGYANQFYTLWHLS